MGWGSKMNYLDFEVEVSAAEAGEYEVQVRSEFGEATGRMRLPFDSLALENRLQALQIALLRSGWASRRVASPEEETVERFGRELFDALFRDGPVLGRFEAARDGAWRREAGLRLKLRITAPELAALPWEYLYDSSQSDFLALSVTTPVVRFVPIARPIRPLAVRPPLRLLGLIAGSDDLPGLDTERERQRLETALKPLIDRELIDLTWLIGGTWRELQDRLLHGTWHVFHFIGHGGFDAVRGEGFIYLPDESGHASRLPATGLGRLLGDHDALRLAILNACEGARADKLDVFSSTAASLVRRGTPAVVAMQYEITDRAAIEFSRSFYTAVASGRPIDAALAVARTSISLEIPGSLEWGTPALFMRSPDGVLFDLAEPLAKPAVVAPMERVVDRPPGLVEPAPAPEPEPAPVAARPEAVEQERAAEPERAVERAPTPPEAGRGALELGAIELGTPEPEPAVVRAAPAAPPPIVAPPEAAAAIAGVPEATTARSAEANVAATPALAASPLADAWRLGYGHAAIGSAVGGVVALYLAVGANFVMTLKDETGFTDSDTAWMLNLISLIGAIAIGAAIGAFAALFIGRQRHAGSTAVMIAVIAIVGAAFISLSDTFSNATDSAVMAEAYPPAILLTLVAGLAGRAIANVFRPSSA